MNTKFCTANLSDHLGSKFHLSEAKKVLCMRPPIPTVYGTYVDSKVCSNYVIQRHEVSRHEPTAICPRHKRRMRRLSVENVAQPNVVTMKQNVRGLSTIVKDF